MHPFYMIKIGTYFKYILLDESQDTSKSQWKNLLPLVKNCLSEGGEVIVVGDVKQSIYRWRGGDINLLIEGVQKDVYPFQAEVKHLSINYRSSIDVVESNNELLKKCLKALHRLGYDDVEKFYENFEQDAYLSKKGHVTYSKIKADKDFVDQSLHIMLKRIENLIQDQNYSYGDITILVRYNKESSIVAEYLKSNNIPILSSEALYIQNSDEVKFIISLLKYVQNNRDDISRAFILNYLKLNLSNIGREFFERELKSKYLIDFDKIQNQDCFMAVENIISVFHLQKKSPAYLIELLNIILDFSSKNSSTIHAFLGILG